MIPLLGLAANKSFTTCETLHGLSLDLRSDPARRTRKGKLLHSTENPHSAPLAPFPPRRLMQKKKKSARSRSSSGRISHIQVGGVGADSRIPFALPLPPSPSLLFRLFFRSFSPTIPRTTTNLEYPKFSSVLAAGSGQRAAEEHGRRSRRSRNPSGRPLSSAACSQPAKRCFTIGHWWRGRHPTPFAPRSHPSRGSIRQLQPSTSFHQRLLGRRPCRQQESDTSNPDLVPAEDGILARRPNGCA